MSESKPVKNRLIIQSKHVGVKYEKLFFLELQQAILDGWRVVDNNVLVDQSRRMYMGRWGRVVLFRPEDEQVEGDVKLTLTPSESNGEVVQAEQDEEPKKSGRGKGKKV